MPNELNWISVGADVILGVTNLLVALCVTILVLRRNRRLHTIAAVFIAFFIVCGISHLARTLHLWYPVDVIEDTSSVLVAIMSVMLVVAFWPSSPYIKNLPSPSVLLDKIGEKDRALEEKERALEALRQQQLEMIALQEHDRRQKLLIGELNHRVKNTLAVVQSIARQSLRTAKDMEHFSETFQDRLIALAKTHTLLLDVGWENASFVDLTSRLLDPYGKRFRYTGNDLILAPQAALSLGMAIHELATNAIKHGAWRSPCGLVEVAVHAAEEGRVEIVWRETGGPTVNKPKSGSFGSRLLRDGVPRELRAEAYKEFLPEGIVYHLKVPLSPLVQLTETGPSSFAASA